MIPYQKKYWFYMDLQWFPTKNLQRFPTKKHVRIQGEDLNQSNLQQLSP